MKNVIFIAPPAAGKGTQSSILKDNGYIHISTGDMLREEISKESELGNRIKGIMESGGLVSDELVFELVTNKLESINKPFILDGYPRTYKQAVMLNGLFERLDINNYEVIYLDIDEELALKRSLGRLTCTCGASYNHYFTDLAPKVDGICDKCGNELTKRGDDNEESFRNRFKTFVDNSKEILDFYKSKNKLNTIDTNELSSIEIAEKVKEILND